MLIDFESADPARQRVRDALIQFHAIGAPNITYTMLEDSLVAGRYRHHELVPGTYILFARRVGSAAIQDTIRIVAGTTDSAIYRTFTAENCINY